MDRSEFVPPTTRSAGMEIDQLHRLGDVDDVVFQAIDGDAEALNRAAATLRAAEAECDREALRESKRQYLRYAGVVWRTLRLDAAAHPARLLSLLKIVAILNYFDW